MAKVFVIHGHDTEARDELVALLRDVNLEWDSFDNVSSRLGAVPFIADVIAAGIRDAHAVVALFTPDEQTALYNPKTSEYQGARSGGSRWQARPNVIFEAGLALGVARERMLMVTLGEDVELFSNIGGVYVIRLDAPGGKQLFLQKLARIIADASSQLGDAKTGVDFACVTRKRWPHYDELAHLEQALADKRVGRLQLQLLEVFQTVVQQTQHVDWRRRSPLDFADEVNAHWPKTLVSSETAWWCIALGIFEFNYIDQNWIEKEWRKTVSNAVFSERGLRLITKWQILTSDGLTSR
jgi:hypothetical protein